MNKKIIIASLLALSLILSVTTFEVYALESGKAKKHHMGFEKKFFCKAHMILKNQDELGLSDNQVEKIKDLKTKVKKDLIRKSAEIDIIALDIKAALYGEQIDKDAVDKLIDRKYDLKKEKAKSLVGAYAAIKGILTSEQKNKLKDLWKKCKKEMMQSPMMKSEMSCPVKSGKM